MAQTAAAVALGDSDSDTPSAPATPNGAVGRPAAAGKPPGAQIRRRATGQVAKPNSARAAGAGGSSNTMLKLYTDDAPGLRVCVLLVDDQMMIDIDASGLL
ncbi:hypothetical protein OE88DRAFT_1660640 [Heliocybe sulcata]|uniref:Uncharacterized protein n=1 Tax=Heliocybe sulcata TaxID=5364 RepID=A0A5C3MYE0_9AGAM|nr:hypothetical protein OE88DRAFT_1660640 [Heliocybe sulcata]